MFKKGEGKLVNRPKTLIQHQESVTKMETRVTRSRNLAKETVIVMPHYIRQKREGQFHERKESLQIRPICEESINESSISYEISIQYKTPEKRSQTQSAQIAMPKNHRKQKKIALNNVLEIHINNEDCQMEQKKKDFKNEFDFFNRRQTRESENSPKQPTKTQKSLYERQPSIQFECKEKKTNSKIFIKEKLRKVDEKGQDKLENLSRDDAKSLLEAIRKKSEPMRSMSKKEQKLNKIQRKANEIEQKGDLQDIAKQIQKLNKKSGSQLEGSQNSVYSFSNSRSFISQLKNSSSSHNSSNVSTKTKFKSRKLRSEQFCLSSRTTKIIRPDTDPMHYRRPQRGNNLSSSMRRDQLFDQPDISTISFYDDKQLAVIEESIYEVKSQEISLLQVEDWIKFVCLILKLDKRAFNKIVRLLNKVVEPSDPMEAIFYYAGACVSLYAKIQCQHMFHEQQKEFPEIPHNSENKRTEIESLHPILEIKQLRRAEWQVSDTVNFRFELHDTLIDECLSTCELWNKYMNANKETIQKRIPFAFEWMTIGTENDHQRRNYLYCSYIIDVIQFLKELNQTEQAFINVNEPKNGTNDSPVTSSSHAEPMISRNLQMILLSIFVVISRNFSQRCSKTNDSLTDSMLYVSKFSKKIFMFSDKKILHLQWLMKKAKEMQIQNLLSRIELEDLQKMEQKTKKMKSKEQISIYIQNKTLWFRNVGHAKTHQQLQWFL